MKVRVAAAATVLAAAVTGASAQSAMGAAITSDRECYREDALGQFIGTGFQPLQPIALSIDGRQLASGPANPQGGVVAVVRPGSIPTSEKTRTLSMTQQTSTPGLMITATKPIKTTQLYVVTKPSSFRPGRRLRIRAGGFYAAGPTLYGHVRGPKRRNLRIGAVKGDCGKVSATKKVLLKKGDSPGIYRIQFDTLRRFGGLRTQLAPFCESTAPGPYCVRGYRIRRIFRFSRTSSFSGPVFGSQARRLPAEARIL